MRTHFIIALLGLSALGGCVVEPAPEPSREFESFRMNWGYGPCAPGGDCSGSLELDASGRFLLDTPCMDGLGIDCNFESPDTYVFTISDADLDAAVAVLTDPDLVSLLAREAAVCEQALDVGEQMVLVMAGIEHANETVFCDARPVADARAVLAELVNEYLIGEPPSSTRTLVSAGWSFGFCGGACVGELAFDGTAVQLTITGHEPGGEVYLDNAGDLTGDGLQALQTALAALTGVALEETYGCPDCVDGGASHVTLARDGVTSTHTYEYGEPPEVLTELDALLEKLNDALETCTANEYIEIGDGCKPRAE